MAAILAGVFFRFYHLDRKTFWEDEILGTVRMLGYTEAEIVQASPRLRDAAAVQSYFRVGNQAPDGAAGPAGTVRSLAAEDPQHPPLYYVLDRLWVERAGTSVAALRALPALFGVLALFATYLLSVELFASRGAAWIAVALLALSPFQVLYSQEAREYTLWTVAILISSALLLRAARTGSRALWIAYGASAVAALYVFPLSAFVIAGHGVYLAVCGDIRKPGVAAWYLGSCAAAALAFLPWLRAMSGSAGLERGMSGIMSARTSPPGIALALLRNVKSSFFDVGFFKIGPLRSTAINAVGTLAAGALAGYAGYVLARGGRRKAAAFVLVALTFPGLPIVVHDLLRGGGLVEQTRYFVPVYLAAVLAVAYLFDVRIRDGTNGKRRLWGAAFACVLLAGFVSCALSSQARTWWNKDYERTPEVAAIVNSAHRPLVVGDSGTSRLLGLSYYLDPNVALAVRLHCEQCAIASPPPENLLADVDRFGDVFLLGPYGSGRERFHAIGIRIYPPVPAPLNMFLSVM